MARYTVNIQTPMAPEDAFAYMADLCNFAEWDEGVSSVEQVEGDGGGPDTTFDVAVKIVAGQTLTLRYVTETYDAPHELVAFADSTLLTSRDTITVVPSDGGSIVTYDAVLELKSVLGLFDPLLGLSFKQIGDRATKGLVDVLNGDRVAAPTN